MNINAAGRQVEIECEDTNVKPSDIRDLALEAWKATDGARSSEGPAFGLQATERRPTSDHFDWRMGEGLPTPVQA